MIADQPGRPFAQKVLDGIQEATRDAIGLSTFVEFLGPTALESKSVQEARERLLGARYGNQKIEVLVAVGDQTIPLITNLQKTRFPAAKLFFLVLSADSIRQDLTKGEGILLNMNPLPSANLALALIPGISRIVVVGGTAPPDELIRDYFRQSLTELSRRVEVSYLTGLTLPELRENVKRLPPSSLIVLTSNFADRSGRATNNLDQAREISQAAGLPVVEGSDLSFGSGSLGGDLVAFHLTGVEIGKRIRRTLNTGQSPAGVAVEDSPRVRVLDWRQLQRLGVPESRVPRGYRVLFRQPTFLEQHLGKLLIGIAILSLQAILISFLLTERRRRSQSQARMEKQLKLEAAISKASAEISTVNYRQLAESLQHVSSELAAILGLDRVVSWRRLSQDAAPNAFHWWPSIDPPVLSLETLSRLSYLRERLRSGGEVALASIEDLPPEAEEDKRALRELRVHSLLILPLRAGDVPMGALSFTSYARKVEWPAEVVSALRVLADIVAQSLSRALAEERESRSEETNRAMLASLPGFVSMIDATGTILQMSNRLGVPTSELPDPLASALKGRNLLGLWRSDPDGVSIADEIEAMIGGSETGVGVEYRYETEQGTRWLEVRTERLVGAEPGAVVSHVDITARKQAESENATNRETVWHLNRVAALGELTASLAHEINQPLAGILNSAEAAAALLDQPQPDLPEIREAVRDIIEDDKRAGLVIQEMRSMLRRKHEGPRAIDLNQTVTETLRLLANEARLNHVALRSDYAEDLPLVAAEPVQLQQILVNLISNAIDAVESMPADRRELSIRTYCVEGQQSPVLEVRDSGPGVPAHILHTVFDPFITTKKKGLGLGLSICRSIVESFGGRISAENAADGGAVFRVIFRRAMDLAEPRMTE